MYSAYIDNFLNAKDAVRIAKEAKPAFHKFLEVWSSALWWRYELQQSKLVSRLDVQFDL